MRIWLCIIRKSVRETMRQRSSLLFMIVMPILFTFVFGVAPGLAGNRVVLAVVDRDHTPVSIAVIQSLQRLPDVTVRGVNGVAAHDLLRAQQAEFIVQVPAGFQQRALAGNAVRLDLVPSPNEAGMAEGDWAMQNTLRTQMVRNELAGQTALQAAKQRGQEGTGALVGSFVRGIKHAPLMQGLIVAHGQVMQTNQSTVDLSNSQQSIVGFATMFIVYAVIGRVATLYQEKRDGTWDRLKASGSAPRDIVGGYALSMFLNGWMQFLIMYLAGRYMFGIFVPFGVWTMVAVSLYILAIVGIALCIHGLSKSLQQLNAIGQLMAVITSMIGGADWSLGMEPKWMQHIAWFVPQNWVMEAFRAIIANGGSTGALVLPLSVLAAFAVAFLGVGMVQLRYA